MTVRTGHLVVVLLVLGASGLVHGVSTNRWATLAPANKGLDLLHTMVEPVGDWTPAEILPDPETDDDPDKTRVLARRFRSTRGDRTVVVSVTSGLPGIVAAHTPEICYPGSGYKLKGSKKLQTVQLGGGKTATFWTADFQKTTATGTETLRVRWAWTADGNWEAPNSPRWSFARVPVLYKVYVVHPVVEDEDLGKDDPYVNFISAFIPAINRHFAKQ